MNASEARALSSKRVAPEDLALARFNCLIEGAIRVSCSKGREKTRVHLSRVLFGTPVFDFSLVIKNLMEIWTSRGYSVSFDKQKNILKLDWKTRVTLSSLPSAAAKAPGARAPVRQGGDQETLEIKIEY